MDIFFGLFIIHTAQLCFQAQKKQQIRWGGNHQITLNTLFYFCTISSPQLPYVCFHLDCGQILVIFLKQNTDEISTIVSISRIFLFTNTILA